MIYHLKRNEIDAVKYDNCVENAINSRIYAFSWYLDIVADNWDVLVLNDYDAVMPLPWRRKYFIKYVYPPCWTQQLGVFSINLISENLVQDFINAIPNRFKKVTIQFNSNNSISKEGQKKVNYVLFLDVSYDDIYKKYRKDRKDRLKKIIKENRISIGKVDVSEIIKLFEKNYQEKKILPVKDYKKLEKLASVLLSKGKIELEGVYNMNLELISGAIFLKDEKRVTYLFSASSLEGKKRQSSTLLINTMIKKNSDSHFIFDFEGSMIPGIASFYKSFGAERECYNNLRYNNFPSFLKLLKKYQFKF